MLSTAGCDAEAVTEACDCREILQLTKSACQPQTSRRVFVLLKGYLPNVITVSTGINHHAHGFLSS